MPDYVEALERELVEAASKRTFARLETVYLGGGTPSLLPAPLITRLLAFIRETFELAPDAEVTSRPTPAAQTPSGLGAWLDGGVNR